MATQPTQLPVPSEKPQDLKFNAGKIDEFVTSMGWTYTDRFGNKHYTIEGMRWLAQQAIAQYGYITIDSFQAGATVSLPNQALRDTSTGEYYRWDGALPKFVPFNSTPASTGGVGVGAWLSVGDATLRPRVKALEDEVGILSFRESSVIWADDYPTLQAAYNATPAGGILRLGNKTYEPISPITKAISIVGAGMPSWNSGFTGLTGGSIIKGPLAHKADNVRLFNFGVDSGSAVCSSLYAGVAQEGLVCLAADAAQLRYGFVAQNIITIAKDSTSLVHAWALERHSGPIVDNVKTCYGIHGQAYKTIDGNVSNIYSVSAGGNGVIIKRDYNAEGNFSNFSNVSVNCYGGGGSGVRTTASGITLISNSGDQSLSLSQGALGNINISNGTVRGAYQYGVSIIGSTVGGASDTVNDCSLTNVKTYDCGINGFYGVGRIRRIWLFSCHSSASVQFGFQDSTQSNGFYMVGCFAGNGSTGFVGFGANFKTINCVTDNNSGFGYYAKSGASCYRSGCSGSEAALFSQDSGTYWFEANLLNNTGLPTTATLSNSWVAFGSGYGDPQYFLASDGTVRMQGAIKSGAIPSIAFTLPVGFRPPVTRRFPISSTTSSADVVGHAIISTAGAVTINSGGNVFVSLDGIIFVPSR